jgi:hypothetical protein
MEAWHLCLCRAFTKTERWQTLKVVNDLSDRINVVNEKKQQKRRNNKDEEITKTKKY